MPKSVITDHYTAEITLNLVERNTYGDALNDNVITMTRKVTVKGGAGLGFLITQLDAAIDNVNASNR